jgi:hypothetical protein
MPHPPTIGTHTTRLLQPLEKRPAAVIEEHSLLAHAAQPAENGGAFYEDMKVPLDRLMLPPNAMHVAVLLEKKDAYFLGGKTLVEP